MIALPNLFRYFLLHLVYFEMKLCIMVLLNLMISTVLLLQWEAKDFLKHLLASTFEIDSLSSTDINPKQSKRFYCRHFPFSCKNRENFHSNPPLSFDSAENWFMVSTANPQHTSDWNKAALYENFHFPLCPKNSCPNHLSSITAPTPPVGFLNLPSSPLLACRLFEGGRHLHPDDKDLVGEAIHLKELFEDVLVTHLMIKT